MSIGNKVINSTDTVLFSSTGDTAITFLSLCNYSSTDQTVSINVVNNGSVSGTDNLFIKDIVITPADTYVVYQGGEKIILANGDAIHGISSTSASVTAIVSYMVI